MCYQWEEKNSVRRETSAVSGMRPKIVRKNQTTLPPHLLSQPYHEVEVCRGRSIRGRSKHGPILRQPCKYFLKGTALNYFVSIAVLTNVNSISVNRDVNSAIRACLHAERLRDNPAKNRRRMVTKSAVAFLKSVRQLSCVSQDAELPESLAISRKNTSFGTDSRSTIHKGCTASS